ncbi:hypothetical protein Poly30_34980 [Planctomycetes bacterium Poly30]|uniref:Preprotein translocase subunit SecD n=1 Tax=Saltatorellus ferox TaxID=2528018 RepID=A0A518EV40_9BACT|nr:hypothetical protein Poly30_34980 [Planctomycetes bacterium Poly30]
MFTTPSTTRLLPIAGMALAFAAPTFFQSDHTSEPPTRFVLTIDGDTHSMIAGEPLELLMGDRKHTLSLEEADTRIVQAAGLRFEYPRMMSFEYEKDLFSKIWTLDGNDAVVMVFEFPIAPSVEEFTAEQVSAYSSLGEVESSEIEIVLEGEAVEGTRLTVVADMFSLLVEIFPIDGDTSSKRWIVLQDSTDDVGSTSEEFDDIKAMIVETLTRTP